MIPDFDTGSSYVSTKTGLLLAASFVHTICFILLYLFYYTHPLRFPAVDSTELPSHTLII
jgi:hypothetical protein